MRGKGHSDRCIDIPESSIRTRVTFEKGIQELGGKTILFPPEALDKRENLRDVIGYLENWADAVVVRHSESDKGRFPGISDYIAAYAAGDFMLSVGQEIV